MMRIRLETSDGRLVSNEELPLFKMLPDVVVWGTRCFQKHGLNADGPIYRECFLWVIPEFEPPLSRPGETPTTCSPPDSAGNKSST